MSALDFKRRSSEPELMDDPSVGYEQFQSCLVELARVNRLSLAHRATLDFLDQLVGRIGGRVAPGEAAPGRPPLHIVDVGSGYGDLLRCIRAWSLRRGVPVSLTGVDLNPWSRRAALEASGPDCPIEWVTADALSFEPASAIDVVVSSLFTHHLRDPQIERFLQWMERSARVAWFVNDLHRHPLPYHVFKHTARLAGFHPFVQHDGPISIARAFRVEDWRRLIVAAGLEPSSVQIRWRFPFRLTVARERG